jgi:hypothetical protein
MRVDMLFILKSSVSDPYSFDTDISVSDPYSFDTDPGPAF